MVYRSFSVSGLAAAICCSLFLLALGNTSQAKADQARIAQSINGSASTEDISTEAEPAKSTVHLRVGWINMPPFQRPLAGKLSGVEGLDIDILTKITNALKIEVNLKERSWKEQLDALENGHADLVMGAFRPEEGDDRFHYSLPYRKARVTFLVRNTDKDRYKHGDPVALLLGDQRFRMGYIPGRLFPQQQINQALSTAEAQGRAVSADTDDQNLRNLLEGNIDGFFSDRLSIGAIELEEDRKFTTFAIYLSEPEDVYFLLSKKTVSPAMLDRLNAEIKLLNDTGELKRLLHTEIFSVIIGYLFESLFFKFVVILAIATATLSGLLLAYKEGYSFTGSLFIAAITALGGGLLRDVILYRQPSVLGNPLYLKTVIITATIAYGLIVASNRLLGPARSRLWNKRFPAWMSFDMLQETFDAAGLAAFTVVGVAVALATDVQPLWLWGPICGMLTGAGGGIARDIIRQTGSVSTLKSEFYAEVPLFWGFVLSIFLLSRPMLLDPQQIATAIIATGIAAFATRMAAVYIRMHQKAKRAAPETRQSGS